MRLLTEFVEEMALRRLVAVLLALVLLCAGRAVAQVAQCEGFVRSAVEGLELKDVKVRLVSLEGVQKDVTDVVPFNGYFVVPLYERGSFVLQVVPPEGWSFEPATARVSDQACDQGQEFLFDFAGFTVSGQVLSQGRSDGPGHVQVRLFQAGSSTAVQTVETDSKGAYAFTRVMPGDYRLEASHPAFAFSQASANVKVDRGNARVATSFTVSGFHVVGSISSDGQPAAGVAMYLLTVAPQATKPTCRPGKPLPAGSSLPESLAKHADHFVCATTSDADGKFSFTNIPTGHYEIVPVYGADGIQYDVVPARQAVEVSTASVTVPPFSVGGFTAVGRVLNAGPGKKPLARIGISTSKRQLVTTTDDDGFFKIDGVRSGKETLQFHGIDLQIDPVTVQLSPQNARIPDVVVSRYRVLGYVQLDSGVENRVVRVAGKPVEKDLTLAADGRFAFWAEPGTYTIEPLVSDAEKAQGMVLTPAVHTVTVVDAPVFDVTFGQSKAIVAGTVHCLQATCPGPLTVTLTHSQRGGKLSAQVGADGSFQFKNVLPGKYKASIAPADRLCWEQSTVDVDVPSTSASKDAPPSVTVEFVQNGYVLNVATTHALGLEVISSKDASQRMKFETVARKPNRFCVANSGVYKVHPSGCYHVVPATATFDTASPQTVEFSVSHYELPVHVSSLSPINDLVVETLTDGEIGTAETVAQQQEGNKHKATFVVVAAPRQTVVITPRSSDVLFYPPSRTINVKEYEGCAPAIETFTARRGQFWEGKIEPAVGDVQVDAVTEDGAVAASTKSQANGHYRVGPLYDDVSYTLKASKNGYIFVTGDRPTDFHSKKLSDVTVHVTYNGVGVAGVIVSLSGSNMFRLNNQTRDDGTYTFWALQPGPFHVRPVLKEYIFEPPTQMITLAEGQSLPVTFKAIRVGYSVFGRIVSLVGEGQGGLTVEAVSSTGDHKEQTTSEPSGAFRLRGLKPEHRYNVQVPLTKGLRRVLPQDGYTLDMEHADVTEGIHFVGMPRRDTVDVTGRLVHFEQDDMRDLVIELVQESEPTTVIRAVNAGPTEFFELRDVPASNAYLVRLRWPGISARPTSTFRVPTEATGDQPAYFVRALLPPQTKQSAASGTAATAGDLDSSGANGSLLLLFFIGVAGFAGLNYKKTRDLVDTFMVSATAAAAGQSTANTNNRSDFLPAQHTSSPGNSPTSPVRRKR